MSNGVLAQSAFRYQDWCAIYFLLERYLDNNNSFEYLICENDKLDFEIWLNSQFEGYQVKSKENFSAQGLNNLLKFSLNYTKNIQKDCFIYLIFQKEPIKSFRFLVLRLAGDKSIMRINGIIENYFSNALNNLIGLERIELDYKILSEKGVQYSVYGLAKKVLEKHYRDDEDLPTGMIDNFIVRLKDKIEEMSASSDIKDRRIETIILKNIINKVISSHQDKLGNSKYIRIELPIDDPIEFSIKKSPLLEKPKILPIE